MVRTNCTLNDSKEQDFLPPARAASVLWLALGLASTMLTNLPYGHPTSSPPLPRPELLHWTCPPTWSQPLPKSALHPPWLCGSVLSLRSQLRRYFLGMLPRLRPFPKQMRSSCWASSRLPSPLHDMKFLSSFHATSQFSSVKLHTAACQLCKRRGHGRLSNQSFPVFGTEPENQ